VTGHLPGDLEGRVRDAYQSAARTVQPQALEQASPLLSAGSVPRRRPMNAFVPVAAAIAVIVAIGVSVALPRLLNSTTGSSPNPATRGTSAAASGHHPPFQIVMTVNDDNRKSTLLVESAATGHVVSRLAPPWPGAMWADVSATADARRFIVAAAPLASPYAPTRLYTLMLSAHGTVTKLAPLAVPALPGELTSMAASADGRTVAYTTFGPRNFYEAGVITGGKTRQWSVAAGVVLGISRVSVSSNGNMIAFILSGLAKGGNEDTAWVLPTSSAPGSIMARARKVYDHTYVGGAGHAMTILESAVISPDASALYLCTAATSASGKTVTRVTAYSTTGLASPRALSAWDNGRLTDLKPVGGTLLIWDRGSFFPGGKSDPTAYLINPATRTRTLLRLRGIPRAQYLTLAW
jgi:hypothetical protein